MMLDFPNDNLRRLAVFMLGSLDDNGYLSRDENRILADFMVDTGIEMQSSDYLTALTMLQSLDPPGVGARDLAECLRLQELAQIFPEYGEELQKIIARFYDLAIPFTEGLVYDVRMKGNYSLKQLVDICSDYSYKDLDIYDGMEAVFSWRDIEKTDPDQGNKIVENLKEYCSLDAYGLFLVYKWLIKLMLES